MRYNFEAPPSRNKEEFATQIEFDPNIKLPSKIARVLVSIYVVNSILDYQAIWQLLFLTRQFPTLTHETK